MPKPIPTPNELTAPFWQAGSQNELKLQQCTACGHIRFPVGPACTQCLSPDSAWVPVSRRAKVLSHLVFHRGYGAGWKDEVPYSVVMIQLPEGPRMFLDVIDPDKRHVEADLVGTDIDIVFEQAAEQIGVPRAVVASS